MATDLPDVQKWWEKKVKVVQEYQAAVRKQASVESGHLEKIAIEEKNAAEDEGEEVDEGRLAEIMTSHKDASPFALDVAAAKAKMMKAIED